MIYYGNELYHHGIKGQKWGERNYQYEDGSLTPEGKKRYGIKGARQALKNEKKEYRKAVKDENKKLSFQGALGFGIKGIEERNRANKRLEKKYSEVENKKRELAIAKKGEKGELDYYTKRMSRTGLKGSFLDQKSGGASTKVYNEMVKRKGREYADRVQKKVRNRAVAQMIAGASVAIGATIASAYINSR